MLNLSLAQGPDGDTSGCKSTCGRPSWRREHHDAGEGGAGHESLSSSHVQPSLGSPAGSKGDFLILLISSQYSGRHSPGEH